MSLVCALATENVWNRLHEVNGDYETMAHI
jgi:hypothetical protein